MNTERFSQLVNDYRSKHWDGNRPLSMEKTAAEFGVSREALYRWMDGEGAPTLSRAIYIADVLGVTLDELTGRC